MPYRNLAAIAKSEQALAARAWPGLTVGQWRRRAMATNVTWALSAALAFGGWAASVPGVAVVGLFLLTVLFTARRVIAVRVRNRWREVAAQTAVLMRDERFDELGLELDRVAPLTRWSPAMYVGATLTRAIVATHVGDDARAAALCASLIDGGWLRAPGFGPIAFDVHVVRATAQLDLGQIAEAQRSLAAAHAELDAWRKSRPTPLSPEDRAMDAERSGTLLVVDALHYARTDDAAAVLALSAAPLEPEPDAPTRWRGDGFTLSTRAARKLTALRAFALAHTKAPPEPPASPELAPRADELDRLARNWPALRAWLDGRAGTEPTTPD